MNHTPLIGQTIIQYTRVNLSPMVLCDIASHTHRAVVGIQTMFRGFVARRLAERRINARAALLAACGGVALSIIEGFIVEVRRTSSVQRRGAVLPCINIFDSCRVQISKRSEQNAIHAFLPHAR